MLKTRVRPDRWLVAVLLLAGCGNAEGPFVAEPEALPVDEQPDYEPPLAPLEDVFGQRPAPGDVSPWVPIATLPEQYFDLIPLQSPVKSQGSRGTCTIFATAALAEHLYIKAGYPDFDLSEQFMQWSVKSEYGAYANSEGSDVWANLAALNYYGAPLEPDWPYEPLPWNTTHDPACEGEQRPTQCYTNGEPPNTAMQAKRYHLSAGSWLSASAQAVKYHLYSKKTAVAVSLEFFYQVWNHGKSTLPINAQYRQMGAVLAPNADDVQKSREKPAGHGILVVGWDDKASFAKRDKDGKVVLDADGQPEMETGFFIFKNSWGTAYWGQTNPHGAGYGYLSPKYLASYGTARISSQPAPNPNPAPDPQPPPDPTPTP